MTPHEKRPGPLTIQLAVDMRIRNLSPRAIDAHTFRAERFADFVQKPLDHATVEDVSGRSPKTLPVVLGGQDVNKLLQCTKNLKQRTFLRALYATGMRFSEAANLRIEDTPTR